MNQDYQYAGKSLTEKIARELIVELFSGKTEIKKKKIRQTVDETHTSRGGFLSTNEMHPVSAALSNLKKQGFAENPAFGLSFLYRVGFSQIQTRFRRSVAAKMPFIFTTIQRIGVWRNMKASPTGHAGLTKLSRIYR